jgi:hypothetical protein
MTENDAWQDIVEGETESQKFRNGMLMSLVISVALVLLLVLLNTVFGR